MPIDPRSAIERIRRQADFEFDVSGSSIRSLYIARNGIYLFILQTHKKSIRIQQHPASAFAAAIKNATYAGQAQAGKTIQANTTQYYSTHASVGTRMPARKLAPLDLANMPTDALYAKKFPLHRPTLSSRKAPFTNEARVTPPGPAASSPSKCMGFIAG
jgi:hypothetical protein